MRKSPAAPHYIQSMTNWSGTGLILVIDDEEGVRLVAQSALERAGYKVLTAVDGPTGLEIFRASAADITLVLLDLTMPGMSGGQVYRALLEIRPGTPVLLSSGYIDGDAGGLLSSPAVAGFIQKPYRPAKLIEQVRAALSGNGTAATA